MSAPKVEIIPISLIDAAKRLREITEAGVDKIAPSMEVGGLIQPITVRPTGTGYKLVVGAHRLAAAKKLGWSEIAAIVDEGLTNDDAQIKEIEENLRRQELSPYDEAEFITLRWRLSLKKRDRRSKLPQLAELSEDIESKEFYQETAALAGVHIETIRRAVLRRRQLDHVWVDLKNTSAANSGAALDRLRKKFKAQAAEVISRAKRDFENNIEMAMDAISTETATKQKSSISANEASKNLEKAWKSCPEPKRKEFVSKHADELTAFLKEGGFL